MLLDINLFDTILIIIVTILIWIVVFLKIYRDNKRELIKKDREKWNEIYNLPDDEFELVYVMGNVYVFSIKSKPKWWMTYWGNHLCYINHADTLECILDSKDMKSVDKMYNRLDAILSTPVNVARIRDYYLNFEIRKKG